jgi:hypothetical protein
MNSESMFLLHLDINNHLFLSFFTNNHLVKITFCSQDSSLNESSSDQYSQYSHYEHYYQASNEIEEVNDETTTLDEDSDKDESGDEKQMKINIRTNLRNSRMKTPRRGSLSRNWAGEIASFFDSLLSTNVKIEKIEIIKQIKVIISEFQVIFLKELKKSNDSLLFNKDFLVDSSKLLLLLLLNC